MKYLASTIYCLYVALVTTVIWFFSNFIYGNFLYHCLNWFLSLNFLFKILIYLLGGSLVTILLTFIVSLLVIPIKSSLLKKKLLVPIFFKISCVLPILVIIYYTFTIWEFSMKIGFWGIALNFLANSIFIFILLPLVYEQEN